MEIRPILSTIIRNPVGLVLIGLQMALTLAIVANALHIIHTRMDNMKAAAGIDEANVLMVTSTAFTDDDNPLDIARSDLDFLRSQPTVVGAMVINTLPMTQSGWSTQVESEEAPDSHNIPIAIYFADETLVEALGLNLIAGRPFRAGEVTPFSMDDSLRPTVVILSAAAVMDLFPELERPEQGLGRKIWNGDKHARVASEIVGIVEGVKAPWRGFAVKIFEHVAFVPHIPMFGTSVRYALRSEPGRLNSLMGTVREQLAAQNPRRVVDEPRSFTEVRERFLRGDKSMAVMLIAVVVLLLLVNVLGIVGLVSFWVTQRTKQIGTRRALGATRGNILRYFLIENVLISGLGVVLGAVLAMALSNWLASEFSVHRLSWHYLAYGAALLVSFGLAATCVPALRAARIAPAIATRSV